MNKKISLILVALMATFLMMCSEDNKVQPAATLTLEPSTDSGKPGSVVTVNIAFNAPNGARSYLYMQVALKLIL